MKGKSTLSARIYLPLHSEQVSVITGIVKQPYLKSSARDKLRELLARV